MLQALEKAIEAEKVIMVEVLMGLGVDSRHGKSEEYKEELLELFKKTVRQNNKVEVVRCLIENSGSYGIISDYMLLSPEPKFLLASAIVQGHAGIAKLFYEKEVRCNQSDINNARAMLAASVTDEATRSAASNILLDFVEVPHIQSASPGLFK
jgi:hypothetical protein